MRTACWLLMIKTLGLFVCFIYSIIINMASEGSTWTQRPYLIKSSIWWKIHQITELQVSRVKGNLYICVRVAYKGSFDQVVWSACVIIKYELTFWVVVSGLKYFYNKQILPFWLKGLEIRVVIFLRLDQWNPNSWKSVFNKACLNREVHRVKWANSAWSTLQEGLWLLWILCRQFWFWRISLVGSFWTESRSGTVGRFSASLTMIELRHPHTVTLRSRPRSNLLTHLQLLIGVGGGGGWFVALLFF